MQVEGICVQAERRSCEARPNSRRTALLPLYRPTASKIALHRVILLRTTSPIDFFGAGRLLSIPSMIRPA